MFWKKQKFNSFKIIKTLLALFTPLASENFHPSGKALESLVSALLPKKQKDKKKKRKTVGDDGKSGKVFLKGITGEV